MKEVMIFFVILIGICGKSAAYSDIYENHWANVFINRLTESKIISGYPDGTYRPDENVTTAEFITMLMKITDDVKPFIGEYWAEPYIKRAEEKEVLIKSEYSNFSTDEKITRAEITKMLVRSCKKSRIAYKDRDEFDNPFSDISVNDIENKRNVMILYETGILSGYPDKTVKLYSNISRAEVAALLCKFKDNKSLLGNFKENEEIVNYEENIRSIGEEGLPFELKKIRYSKENKINFATKIEKINIFKFEKEYNGEYKKVFDEFYNNKDLYFYYRKKFGDGNFVIAVEFTSENNEEKYTGYCGYSFLHLFFPIDSDIEILDSFDIDEIEKQREQDGTIGIMLKPGKKHKTVAFYIVNKVPKKIRFDRFVTTMYDTASNIVKEFDSLYSLVVNLKY